MVDYDETLPDGSKNITLGDDDLRGQSTAIRERLEVEHYFPDNATAARRGRHKFGVGGSAARNAAITSPAAGNVWYNSATYQWEVYTATTGWRGVGAVVGDVKMCARATELDANGWLICDGRELSIATYSLLSSTILANFDDNGVDPPPAAGNFRIPRMQMRVPVGRLAGDPAYQRVGLYGGEEEHTLLEAEVPTHNHGGVTGNTSQVGTTWNDGSGGDPDGRVRKGGTSLLGAYTALPGHTHTIPNFGGGGAHNNMQPFLILGYLIFGGYV